MLTSEIATKLTAAGLTTGYTVLRGKMPPTPDAVIALYETGGTSPEFFQGGSVVEQPGVQVRVRGAAEDYDGPRLVIERIYQAIGGYGAFVASGVRYLGFTPLQAPFAFRRDENQRVEFAVNFLAQKGLSST